VTDVATARVQWAYRCSAAGCPHLAPAHGPHCAEHARFDQIARQLADPVSNASYTITWFLWERGIRRASC
jgi:hypothetical protein